MLTVALCDDEEYQLRLLGELLREFMRVRPEIALRIQAFRSGEELLSACEETGGFDLYILDVLLPGLNGIETGTRLRELGGDGEIIYLTNAQDYAVDSYDVQAFFYLLKPVEQERLFSVLDRAVETLARRRTEGILVTTRGGVRHLLLDRILYAERVGRIMRYYCVDGTVDSLTLRGSFRSAAAPLLADPRFCPCGASYVLNLQHVAGVDGQSAMLDTGARVPLPRSAAGAFKDAWGRFWLEAPQ